MLSPAAMWIMGVTLVVLPFLLTLLLNGTNQADARGRRVSRRWRGRPLR